MTKDDVERALHKCNRRISKLLDKTSDPDEVQDRLEEVRSEIEYLRGEERRLEEELEEADEGMTPEEEDELDALYEEKKRLKRVLDRHEDKEPTEKISL